MFASFFASIGKYAIIGIFTLILIGLGALYVWYTDSKISALTQQVSALSIQAQSLKVANDAMKKDISSVQKAQSDTNAKLEEIRSDAQAAANQIRNQIETTTDVPTLQKDVDTREQQLEKALQDLSK